MLLPSDAVDDYCYYFIVCDVEGRTSVSRGVTRFALNGTLERILLYIMSVCLCFCRVSKKRRGRAC